MAEKKGKDGAGAERPESPKVPVLSIKNEAVREIQLSPTVFAGRVNGHLIYEAVKQYRAGARRGTHATKTRAMVSGSGRKPWRQKGTGRARVGEVRTPLWRSGGTVFGPQPRDYSYPMPKKARAAARVCPSTLGAEKPTLRAPSLQTAVPRITAWTSSPSASASESRFSTTMAAPLPETTPSPRASNERPCPSDERMPPGSKR